MAGVLQCTFNTSVLLYWQQLTSSGDLSYLGAQWRRDVAFAGYNIALQVYICPSAFFTLSLCHAITVKAFCAYHFDLNQPCLPATAKDSW